ncbi:MAG: M48 family metalloprotease [Candidatus Omnitrophica bacterium]|nr:M48 family metalloprotease [Candidatus Omnitrophota bacterium]
MGARTPDPAGAYARGGRRLALAALALELAYLWWLPASGAAQWWAARFDGGSSWPTPAVIGYVAGLAAPLALLQLPLAWARGFRLEHAVGLSRERPGAWAWRWLKAQLVAGALLLAAAVILAQLLRAAPMTWWIWAAVAWVAWSVVLTQWMPVLLLPLFYRQRPLADQALTARIRRLAERCGLGAAGVYELALSRQTAKANACLCGLGTTRRVLLTDTLTAHYTPEEIDAIVAHEAGHARLQHLPRLLAFGALSAGLSVWLVSRWLPGWLARFGIAAPQALATLPVLAALLGTISLAWIPAQRGLSRRFERAADRFALEVTRAPAAFIAAMRKLQRQNLAETDVSRWVEWWWYDHPPIARRVAMAERFAAEGAAA